MTSTNTTDTTPSPATPGSGAPAAKGDTGQSTDKPDVSHAERQGQHYLAVFQAVLSSCVAGAEKAVEEIVDLAIELADAAYHRLFKSQAGAGTGTAPAADPVPDGIHRDPSNPNLDPALPQKLPGDAPDVPVTPPADGKTGDKAPDAPTYPVPGQQPVGDDPANPAPVDPSRDPAVNKPTTDQTPSGQTGAPATPVAATPTHDPSTGVAPSVSTGNVAGKPTGNTDPSAAKGK